MMNVNERKSTVLNNMEVNTKEQAKLRALMAREANTYETIKQIKVDKEYVIDTTKAYSIPSLLSRLGYVAGSMVGIITNLIEISGVLMDNKHNKQFLKADGTADLLKLAKVFPTIGSKGNGEGYDLLFSEDNNNIILVENKQARIARLVKATKADVQRFVDKIEATKVYRQEDLVNIGKDLEKIGRVMQELEIDSAKDATKKEGMLEITEFMSAYTCKIASKKMAIDVNFNEIIANQKAKIKKEVEFKYEVAEFPTLDDAYVEAKKRYETFVTAHPTASQEELTMAKTQAIRESVGEAFILDSASELKYEMVKQQGRFLNTLVDLYKASNMNLFEQFKVVKVDADTADIDAVRRMAVVSIEMINNHFKYTKHLPMTKIDELAGKLRNALYTYGESRGIEPKDTFKIACGAGWYTRTEYKGVEQITIGEKFKYAAIAALFETELKWYFNADAMYTTIEVELPDGAAIDLDTPFYMENGECEIELEDGTTDFIFCTEENYTGAVICKLLNDEPVFVKHIDEYEYETVEFIMYDKVCDLSLDTNKYMANDADANTIITATKAIKEVNTMNLEGEDKELTEKREAERVGRIFTTWANAIELSVINSNNFALYTTKVNNQLYINLRKLDNGAARMLGRISASVKNNKISEYTSMDTVVCAAGAITILN